MTETEHRMRQLVKEFLALLNKIEESDSGREFYPNRIASCRVMDGLRLSSIMKELAGIVQGEEAP